MIATERAEISWKVALGLTLEGSAISCYATVASDRNTLRVGCARSPDIRASLPFLTDPDLVSQLYKTYQSAPRGGSRGGAAGPLDQAGTARRASISTADEQTQSSGLNPSAGQHCLWRVSGATSPSFLWEHACKRRRHVHALMQSFVDFGCQVIGMQLPPWMLP